VVRELLKAGADVEKGDTNGLTPLMGAAHSGHLGVVRELLEAGADVEKEDGHGHKPLHFAAGGGAGEVGGGLGVTQELLKIGAVDVDAGDNTGCTALMSAAHSGHLGVVRELLKAGADVNKENAMGATPLMQAACDGHFSVAWLLAEKGADLSKRATGGGFKGKTALDMAKEGKDGTGHVKYWSSEWMGGKSLVDLLEVTLYPSPAFPT
jgi:ankyrin repeat protein